MGMTLTQKILAAHAGLAEVEAGQLINAKLDIVLGNDITTPVAINEFERAGFDSVFDKEHIAIVLDHFVPNKDIKSADAVQAVPRVRQPTRHHRTSTMWARWASSTPCCPRRASWPPATASSVRTATPAPTARWARSPPAWAPPTWPPVWPPAWRGSRCPLPSSCAQGQAQPPRVRQGRDPAHHRHDRRGRRPVQGHGVHRQRRCLPDHGRPPEHLATWPSRPAARTASSRWTR